MAKAGTDVNMDRIENSESISILSDRSSAYDSSRSTQASEENDPFEDEISDEKEEGVASEGKMKKKKKKKRKHVHGKNHDKEREEDEKERKQRRKKREKAKGAKEAKEAKENKKAKKIETYRPIFIYAICIINVLMFVWLLVEAGWTKENWYKGFLSSVDREFLVKCGAKDVRLIKKGQVWRLFTPLFLHGSLVSLFISNMFLLGPFSRTLERTHGHKACIIVFFASGIFGVLISGIFIPEDIGCGSTGAWFGFVGTMFVDFFKDCNSMNSFRKRTNYFIYICFVTCFLLGIGLLPMIDNYSHCGGWLMGIFTGGALMHPKKKCAWWNDRQECENEASHFCASCRAFFCQVCKNSAHSLDNNRDHKLKKVEKWRKNMATLVWTSVGIVSMIAVFGLFFSNIDMSYCKPCVYFNCVPTPLWHCCKQETITLADNSTKLGPCLTVMKAGLL